MYEVMSLLNVVTIQKVNMGTYKVVNDGKWSISNGNCIETVSNFHMKSMPWI